MGLVASFEDVTKAYNGKDVLKNLSFAVREKSFTALIGNNGCGKSTTVNILCNIVQPDSGEVRVYDKILSQEYMSYKKRVGIVLSTPTFVPTFATHEYLRFICRFQRVPKNEVAKRINEIVDFLEIRNITAPIKNLSLGTQMKVSLAAALIHNPDFLILDEPFVNLDIGTTEQLLKLLKSFSGKKTIFMTSHNLDIVADLCGTFLIMKNGKIEMELIKNESDDTNDIKKKVKKMLEGSANLHELSWLTN